jgi:ketosteroid isomerase-like protein
MLGDPLPPSLATYYADLDAGRLEAAASRFSPDAIYALPPRGAIETAPRAVYEGRDAILAWFHERGRAEYGHDVQVCVHEAVSCLVEGVVRGTRDGEAFGTFVASVGLDAAGSINRYVAFMCSPPTDPSPSGDGPAPADAAAVLHQYFDALDRGDFEAAADQFSADVVYANPPYRHTGIDSNDRVVFRGRDELLTAFRARGKQSFDHAILASIQRGPHCLIEGVVQGLANSGTGSFVSSLTLDDDGRIQRYLSFYCEPAVRRAIPT